jgi:DNA-binding transcriptional MerR regulator
MSVMTPSEVSKLLKISGSTLRKYCLLLEQHGIEFKRNANNSRSYSDEDVISLQRLISLSSNGDMSVENAAMVVSVGVNTEKMLFGERTHNDKENATNNDVERHSDDIAATMLKEIMSLKEEIQGQKEVIDGFRVAQEKRDKYFVEILEQLQGKIDVFNEQKALPPVEEPKQEEPEPQKKGFFNRFFNNK